MKKEYQCPKCKIGELFDANAGGMFMPQIECTNPDCDYSEDDFCGCISGDIED